MTVHSEFLHIDGQLGINTLTQFHFCFKAPTPMSKPYNTIQLISNVHNVPGLRYCLKSIFILYTVHLYKLYTGY